MSLDPPTPATRFHEDLLPLLSGFSPEDIFQTKAIQNYLDSLHKSCVCAGEAEIEPLQQIVNSRLRGLREGNHVRLGVCRLLKYYRGQYEFTHQYTQT